MATADPAKAAPPGLATDFVGRRWPLFWLALKTAVLTVLTLGFYRFWMKTRLRRWYWSAIRPGGKPLEYVGDPYEKLLGFLIAVVVLAFYIGIVNLLLMFASFSWFQGVGFGYALSLIGVVPLWFYAQYRARRYILARTRWRGLRFGLEPGAWGYARRAMVHWLLTILTLGALWPRMTFHLEKYRTDRTWFGDARMEQGGDWRMLYGSARWLLIGLATAIAATVAAAAEAVVPAATLGPVATALCLFGLVYYRVDSLRRLTAQKRVAGAALRLEARPLRVFWIAASGYTLAVLAAALPASVLGVLFLSIQDAETLRQFGMPEMPLDRLGRWALIALGISVYFSIFLLWSAITHALVTLPTIRHYASGLRIDRPEALDAVRQRPRDRHTEAEGFAEALDVGASL